MHNNNDNNDSPNTGTNLFVTGLAIKCRDEDVLALFSKFGNVNLNQTIFKLL